MGENLKEKLFKKKESGWKRLNDSQKEEVFAVSKNFLKKFQTG